MAVLFDASVLILLLQPNAGIPQDPETKKPVEYAKQRLDYLINQLNKGRTKIIVPTPALSELLIHAGSPSVSNSYIQSLQRPPFKIVSFDMRAAIECAEAFRQYGKKDKTSTHAKLKYDRQIVSIGIVEQVEAIYSDDSDIVKYGKQANLNVIRTHQLDIDPNDRQGSLLSEQSPEI
ncbi:MAG: PIN domain-containing protein [Pseudomonadota bacterium]